MDNIKYTNDSFDKAIIINGGVVAWVDWDKEEIESKLSKIKEPADFVEYCFCECICWGTIQECLDSYTEILQEYVGEMTPEDYKRVLDNMVLYDKENNLYLIPNYSDI